GTVTDALKKALPGLLVTLSSRAEPDVLRVTGTNEKGQYLFPELPPGLYDLKVQADGFLDTGKESIEIRPPFQNIVDVQLKPRDKGGPTTAGTGPTAGAGPTSGGGAAPGGAVPQGTVPAGESGSEVAPAPAPVTVRGRFVDQDRRPLYEVSVVLSALQGKAIYQAFSGDDGVFEIPGVVPGRYHVIVRSPGHVPLDLRSVEVLGKNGISVSLMLVDYPLNFKASQQSLTPVEAPRPAPGPPEAVGGAGSAARDGEHAPEQGKPPARDGSPEDRPGG
ncbi:MAG TPA: carboxypeptidase-like regulatory domain-containing protein, partial [Candidatus Cryosericum sp.]|nr:carboxypeptidase-like regulatory domain-containing protein [Candidatus Cryosericum sp.]